MAKDKKDSGIDIESVKTIMSVGSDFCFVFGDDDCDEQMTSTYHYSTGLTVVDAIIGEGGFGSGKISEVYGANRSGKSELAQRTMEHFLTHYPSGLGVYFDEETSLDDKKMAQSPVFRSGRLLVKKSENMEAAFNSIIKMMEYLIKGKIDQPVLIVFDSVAAMATKEEMANDLGKVVVAGQARVLSMALRKIRGMIRKTNAHILFINQTRNKVGGMSFGSNIESACGEALKFYSDYRLKLSNLGSYRFGKGGAPDGYKIQVKTVKNKRVAPLKEVNVPLLFHSFGDPQSGFSEIWSVYDMAKEHALIKVIGGNARLKGAAKEDTFKRPQWPDKFKAESPDIRAVMMDLCNSIMVSNAASDDDEEEDAGKAKQASD